MENLLTCAEVAQKYGVKVSTVWAWIREQRLAAIRIGKSYRVKQKDLEQFENQAKPN
jgi:excisionase family DNA binding protein